MSCIEVLFKMQAPCDEREVNKMPKSLRKSAGAKATLVLLLLFLFLVVMFSVTYAETGKLGDVNGDGNVNVLDVSLVRRHVLEIEELDEDQLKWADVNCDGEVDVQDVILIMQYALHIIDEFPCDLAEIVSVMAIDRTTIEVELADHVSEEIAEDEEFYQATVGNESVEVEEVDYDADDYEAILTVDMSGKSGELIVNGKIADDDVPAEPEFTSISAVQGRRDITLQFNTAIYEKDDLDDDDVEIRVAGEEDVGIEEFDFPQSADDAEDEAIITVAKRPAANDSVVVHIKDSGAAKIVNIWDEPIEEEIESTTAQADDVNPTFDGITVYEDSTFIIATFSEPVNTTGEDEDEEDGEDIPVGPLDDQVRVTGLRADGSTLPSFGGDGISAVDQDDESERLRILLDRAVPAGAEITVSFGGEAGLLIVDRANNILAGTYTRSATAIPGPTLENAKVSDLSANADDQTQWFEVTLIGDMDEDEELTIDLTDATDEGISYSSFNTRYDVEGADGSVTIAGDIITFAPDEYLDDGTTIIIEAEEVDTSGVGAVDDLEVVFERSEVGATATAEFDVLAGLSNIEVEAQYFIRDDPDDENSFTAVSVLASGQDEHTLTFNFTLESMLEDKDSVEIDTSELVDAGVSFDDEELEANIVDVDVEMDNDKIVVTADGDIADGTEITITAEEVDVAFGSSTDDVDVVFTRKDSGYSITKELDIVPGFTDVEVFEVTRGPSEDVLLTFTLDGELEYWRTVRIDIDWEGKGNLVFHDEVDDLASSHGYATMSATGVVTLRARPGSIDDGTEVTIEIIGAVDSSGAGVGDAVTRFRRGIGERRCEKVDILEILD